MSTVRQLSFSSGEIAPSLFARCDTNKYASGLRTLRNNIVMRHGGTANRPGTTFVGEVKDSSKTVRLLKFVFNDSQTYILEFGDMYMRVVQDGAQLTLTAQNITAITNASTGVLTYSGSDTYANGDQVYVSGIVGAIGTYLNNRTFKVASVNTGNNTFQLNYLDGTAVNTTSMGSYTSGGTIEELYQITTPYVEDDLPLIQFVQSADVITLVHPNYAPRELSRTGHTSWTLSEITFAPAQAAPTNPGNGSGAPGSVTLWKITAINGETFEESLPTASTGSANVPSSGTPISVTWTAATDATEYNVYKALNGVYGFIGVAVGTTFSDVGITPDTTTTPPTARNPFALETSKAMSGITLANPAVVTTATHGYATGDVVFISLVVGTVEVNNIYFIVTVLSSTTFSLSTLSGVAVDSSAYTAYGSAGIAQRAGNYPGTVTYVQQRRTFGRSNQNPEKVWMSRSAQHENFTVSAPLQDDDAVTFSLVGKKVNEIRHLLDLGKPLAFTSGAEWTLEGDAAGIIKPTAINPKPQTYNGASTLSPILIGGNALYVQNRGSIVRNLAFEFQADGYRGTDLTIFSTHLFDGYTLVDWDYQQIPHSIVWAVRDDGTLLGVTYIQEQQIVGWHRHDFDGTVENVCVVPEGTEDAVYLVIKRTINGATKRYIERMTTRLIEDLIDTVLMDSTLTYDGRHDGTTTMTLSGGTTWAYDETITLTASVSTFASTDVGNVIQLTGAEGSLIRFTIGHYTSATVVTGKPHMTVPAGMRSIAIATWARAVDELTGLWHLEGETVSVFADKFVVSSPNNESYTTVTVTNGAVALDKPYGVIHIGLPVTADFELLDIDTPTSETLAGKKKWVGKVTLFVESTRGIWVGAQPPEDDDDDPLENLYEAKMRNFEPYDDPVTLRTDYIDIDIAGQWNSNGRVFIRQVDPLPLSILEVAPNGFFPFRGGSQQSGGE